MRKIDREGEPPEWTECKRKHPKAQYKDLEHTEEGRNARKALRIHLVRSQYYLCAYCCRRIEPSGDKSLNEHIKPQGVAAYARYSMDYDNIVASCNRQTAPLTCSAKKDTDYDEKLFVSPLQEDCERHFAYSPTGKIIGVTEAGRYTCDLLGLNTYELQQARRATYKACEAYHDPLLVKGYFLTPKNGELEAFADMIQYFYEKSFFDAALF